MSRWFAALVGTFVLIGAARAHACAGCRNPNMPIARLQAAELEAGQVRATAIVGATSLHVVHVAGCSDAATCQEAPPQPLHLHDQRVLPVELRPIIEAGITARLGIEVHVPLRLARTTVDYKTIEGERYQPIDEGIHHRNETLAGVGDPWLLGRWNLLFAGTLLTTRLGMSLPLGRTEENPFARGAQGLRHQHIQFGSGTFDPVASIELSRTFNKTQLVGYAQAQTALYENAHGFRAGTRWLTGAQAGRRIWRFLNAALGADVLHEGAERWDGRIQQDGNLGRTEVLVGASLLQTFGATTIGITARVPVWRHIISGDAPAGTLSSPLMLSLVASHTLGKL